MRGIFLTSHLSLLTFPLLLVLAVHAVFEALDTFAETAHQLRNLRTAKKQQYD